MTSPHEQMLRDMYAADPMSALFVAEDWSRSTELNKYDAAVVIRDMQDILPKCDLCSWPLYKNTPHKGCELERQFPAEQGIPVPASRRPGSDVHQTVVADINLVGND